MLIKHFICKSMMVASCFLCLVGISEGKGSFTKKMINSAEQALKALKNNPKCIEKIDQVIEDSSEKIGTALKNITNNISKDELKQIFRTCEDEIKQSVQVLSQAVKQEAEIVEHTVRCALGEQNTRIIESELKVCSDSIATKMRASEDKELFRQFSNDMRPAVVLAKQAFEGFQEGLPQ